MLIKGIKVSNGYAIGKAKLIESNEILVNSKKIFDVIVEFNRVRIAIDNVIADILKEKEALTSRLNVNDLLIFDAHILIAKDPEIMAKMKLQIEKEQESAEFVVNKVYDDFINIFQSMDNSFFKDRAEDVLDIKRRILCKLMSIKEIDLSQISEKSIIVSHDLTPSQTVKLSRDNTLGFITEVGGNTSHSAIMARYLEIPAVMGITNITKLINDGDTLILDGYEGSIIINPTLEQLTSFKKKIQLSEQYQEKLQIIKSLPTTTLDDRKIDIAANINNVTDLDVALDVNSDGIGLLRTEFIYMNRSEFPSEEEQYAIYKNVLEKMRNKRVIIRTIDIGGDKTLDYFRLPKEDNPFLGLRAIRLSLKNQVFFRTQIRALLRASLNGKLAIMFPMISTVSELLSAIEVVNSVKTEFRENNIPFGDYEVGMMIETPAAAILAEKFIKYVDFFSIGSNDLIQYTFAADRMNQDVSYLYQPLNPAILHLIKMTIDASHKFNKWTGICGEMASDKLAALLLIGLGIDELSMSPSYTLQIKDLLLSSSYKDLRNIANRVLMLESETEVLAYLNDYCNL